MCPPGWLRRTYVSARLVGADLCVRPLAQVKEGAHAGAPLHYRRDVTWSAKVTAMQ
jgi:hypothetical protein